MKDNPHIERNSQWCATFSLEALVIGLSPDGGFKEVLSKISEANPTSALANTYGRRMQNPLR